MVLPYLERTEPYQGPFLDRCFCLDQEQFKPVMGEFYALHGWENESGRPTRERLRELCLEDVHKPMLEGAMRARCPPDQG